jgi:hypothetical protein
MQRLDKASEITAAKTISLGLRTTVLAAAELKSELAQKVALPSL